MPNQRPVTEEDFRLPEFRGAKAEDYEFREDGKLVRKDRWRNAIISICDLVRLNPREFEVDDVVSAVASLTRDWNDPVLDVAPLNQPLEVLLDDDSLLKGVRFETKEVLLWDGLCIPISRAKGWREPLTS